jgi:dsRNA-specific ribonuclease
MVVHYFFEEDLHSLPKENVERLIAHLGLQVNRSAWLQLSLVHRSVLGGSTLAAEISNLLGMLQALGSSLLQLATHDYAVNQARLTTPKAASDFVNRVVTLMLPSLVNSLKLIDNAYWAQSVPLNERDSIAQTIALQIVAALYLSESYKHLRSVVDPVMLELRRYLPTESSTRDFKTLLQEHAQAKKKSHPVYETLNETGPEHNKRFVVRVTVGPFSSEGIGSSKKEAGQEAAAAWFRQYSPDALRESSRLPLSTSGVQKRIPLTELPKSWLSDSEAIRTAFHIPFSKLPLLIEALTHRSMQGARDYSILAQLGAAVLDVIVSELSFDALIRTSPMTLSDYRFMTVRAALLTKSAVVRLSELLGLQRLLLVGSAQKASVTTAAMLADIAQAVLATAYIVQSPSSTIVSILPSDVRLHLEAAVLANTGSTNSTLRDPKSLLQEVLTSMRLSVTYSTSESGPKHKATFQAQCTISDIHSGTQARVLGGLGTSRKAAEARLASRVLSAFAVMNNFDAPTGQLLRSTLSQSPKLSRLVLSRELASPPTTAANCARWWARELLGARALKAQRLDLFCAWLRETESTLGEITTVHGELTKEYLRHARLQSTAELRLRFKNALSSVEKMVQDLDPENDKRFFSTANDGYRLLLILSAVTRLIAAPRTITKLRDELVNLKDLRSSSESPMVPLKGEIPDVMISQNDGMLFCLINSIVEALGDHRRPDTCLAFSFDATEKLTTVTVGPLSEPQQLVLSWQEDLLLQFLREELSINSMAVASESISIPCGPFFDSADHSLCATLIGVYRGCEYLYTKPEAHLAARLLHDLKNTLMAYGVVVSQESRSVTQALAHKLQASKHRDAALMLIASLVILWGTLSDPVGVSVEPVKFIRSIVAEEYPTIPDGVRLIPPAAKKEEPFTTSPEFLRSIVHNLIKNAYEAMPDGGDINIDCIRIDDSLIVEITDQGSGMSPEQLQKLASGEQLATTKKAGSGLGLLTVRAMLAKINGRLTGSVEPGTGMRWTIELDQMQMPATEIES